MKHSRPQRRIQRQRGAALIVGLVLMMVLTILAVSTMRTATLELAMAGNTQYHEKARQLAQAGIATAIDDINNGGYDPVTVNPGGWTLGRWAGEIDGEAGDTYSVDIRYLNTGQPPVGFSQDLEAYYFEIRSTGRTAARNARAVLVRGFWKFSDL